MSKWTEIRDGMVSALDVSDVVESAKNQMITDLTGTAWTHFLPLRISLSRRYKPRLIMSRAVHGT